MASFRSALGVKFTEKRTADSYKSKVGSKGHREPVNRSDGPS